MLSLSLKSPSKTRCVCRYEAIRAVDEQLKQTIKMLEFLVLDKYLVAKASFEARCLLETIGTFNFS